MSSILQVLPDFHTGGVEQTTLLVANALAEKGWKSFIASAKGILTESLHPDVVHIDLPLNSKNPLIMFSNVKELIKIIEGHSINIVHARSRAPGWSAYFAAKSKDATFLTTYHGAYSQNFFKWYYNRVMTMGKLVVVASSYMENHVKKYYPSAECIKIPSGINTQYFSPEEANVAQEQELKLLWGIKAYTKIILLVGRFTPIKGHKVLLQALSKSIFKDQIKVVFVGDGKNPNFIEDLKGQAAGCKLELHIHTDEKDLRPFFSVADAVVVPTTKPEAFGRVTVEAMSMSKLVIVNDLGASSEVLNDQDWVFDHCHVESLTQKIDNALNLGAEQAQAVGAANRMRASTLYDVDALIESHLQLYKRFL